MQSGLGFPRRRARVGFSVECLEPRQFLSASVIQAIAPVTVQQGGSSTVDLRNNFTDTSASGTIVEFDTAGGNIDVELSDAATPITVANFLNYVNQGLYNGTIIHRSVSNFVVQGGGYLTDGTPIQTFAPIMNEFGQSNVEGTIAMAKLSGDPNSATSQWFFNVANNSQNLDNQNGGFTVFGKVISGFNIIQQINQLPTTSAMIGPSSFDGLPVVNLPSGATPTAANLVTLNQVFVAPKNSFTATSDVPGLVNPIISSTGVMTLNAAPNASGYANITVTAVGNVGGGEVIDTFRVHVAASANRTLAVNLGGNAPSTINFQVGPGNSGRVSLAGPGTAVLEFTGDNLKLSGADVTGTNVQLDSITASGTTSASTLTAAGSRAGTSSVTVGAITSSGSFNEITVRGTLQGDLNVAGTIRVIHVAQAEDGTLTVGSSSNAVKLTVLHSSFANENLVSAEPIQLIKAYNWSNLDSISEVVQAPSIHQIQTLGNFSPGVQVTQGGNTGLGTLNIPGLIGGTWSIPGHLPSLHVGGTEADFNATFTQPLGNLRFVRGFSGSLTAPSIASLYVAADVNQATLTLTAPFDPLKSDLGSLSVKGGLISSSIISAGNVGPVSAQRVVDSTVFAGVATLPPGQLPQAASDFASAANITSLTTRPPAGAPGFVGSLVAAQKIGPVNLTRLQTDNTFPFGFAAHSIASLTGVDVSHSQTFALKDLNSPATLASQVTAQNLTLEKMMINLI